MQIIIIIITITRHIVKMYISGCLGGGGGG